MAIARRTRTLAAAPERVWEVVEDPHHLPRWWPGVTRMEAVQDDSWTEVFTTKKGRPVRVDFRLLESEQPDPAGAGTARRRWEQEIIGTPFERLLNEAVTAIELERAGEGTKVKLELRQKLRGYSRVGSVMLRRATGKKLDEALDALEQICL
jgi:carbon monoxide dehydrogenase subunit G